MVNRLKEKTFISDKFNINWFNKGKKQNGQVVITTTLVIQILSVQIKSSDHLEIFLQQKQVTENFYLI